MIGVWRAGEPEIGQHEGCADLGDKLLRRVGAAAEATGEITGETVSGARPVNELMRERPRVASERGKGGARWQLDGVAG